MMIRRSFAGRAYLAAGIGLTLWIGALTLAVPAAAAQLHWSLAWAALDGAEATALLGTGWLLLRGDRRCAFTALAFAVLVTCDASIDISTSVPGVDRWFALLEAAFAEIPAAALSVALAVRVLAGRAPSVPNPEES